MVVVSMLPHTDFGPNDNRDDALHFISQIIYFKILSKMKNKLSFIDIKCYNSAIS